MHPLAAVEGEEPAPQGRTARSAKILAALDLGTNNCRLLIARGTDDGYTIIDAFSRIIRLGEGLGESGHLTPAAVERGLSALRVCATKIRRRGVTHSRAVVTEAGRKAANFSEFGSRVRRATGIALEVITADEEARLVLAGCRALLDGRVPHALMFDIGGGSTELMWLRVHHDPSHAHPPVELIDAASLPLGVVGLCERYGGDRVSDRCYAAMVDEAAAAMAPFDRRHGISGRIAHGDVQMLGSSGTVTTLAALSKGLARYDRSRVDGSRLRCDDAMAVVQALLGHDFATRAANPCIGRDRADLVIAGCAVLEAICRLWPLPSLRVADRGVREGILSDLVAASQPDRPRGQIG